ncbi:MULTISPECIES: hypothetical protein [unclassified Streptomyces]|uniref:anti-sigma factor family protein n=1 Tax=unclassified Streptomyces TaxID=2593676 RepID=UPI002ED53AC2|nr:hypothetical protein OH827_16625 [Streptomyces sp. NBC_00891]WSY06535.1 hypothetical protein OG464_16625 [Streptomyces sp. NBC_00890]WSZ08159.1 hypothetical protein OG704_16625 [Streptomyces sp. NBC_00869]WSZ24341.1 hypothetical protein OG498_16940 [Streptomyces sp. NBC_00870]
MTSAADTTQHPDVSEISDLTEGLLTESRAAEVRSHTDTCDLCGDVLASLEEIRSLLGDLPAPPPMPGDIADRIDAALAAEAASRRTQATAADVSREAADVSRETEPEPIAAAVPPRSGTPDRPTGHARAGTGPGRRPGPTRRRATLLATALGAAALTGMSVFLLQNVPDSQSSSDTSAVSQDTGGRSNARVYSQATLENQVDALLNERADVASQGPGAKEQAPSVGSKSSPQSDPSDPMPPEAPLRAPAVTVPTCVKEGIGRNSDALAIEKGSYEGTDAYLVVLPHPTDPAGVQAYVVDAACVGAEPPAKGKLLLTHTYNRP